MKKVISVLLAVSMLFAMLSVNGWVSAVEHIEGDFVLTTEPPSWWNLAIPPYDGYLLKYNGSAETLTLASVSTDEGDLKIAGICENAFAENKTIKTVFILWGVSFFDKHAFSGCTALENVMILNPKAVSCQILDFAFENCVSLRYFEVHTGTTKIGKGAFSGCSSLRTVTIPSEVTEIAKDAFAGCSPDLCILGSPNSYAEQYAKENEIRFQPADNTKDFSYSSILPGQENDDDILLIEPTHLYKYNGNAKVVTIPMRGPFSVTDLICENAFAGNTAVEEVVVPMTITAIHKRAFADCTSLKRVTILSKNTKIAAEAFAGCSPELTIIAPEGSEAQKYAVANGFKYQASNRKTVSAVIKGSATSQPTTKTQKVTVKKVKKLTVSKKGRTVTIKIVKANKKYKSLIQYKKQGAKKYKKLALTNKTKVTKTLRKGKYQIRTCSYVKQNGKVYKSKFTNARTVKIK